MDKMTIAKYVSAALERLRDSHPKMPFDIDNVRAALTENYADEVYDLKDKDLSEELNSRIGLGIRKAGSGKFGLWQFGHGVPARSRQIRRS